MEQKPRPFAHDVDAYPAPRSPEAPLPRRPGFPVAAGLVLLALGALLVIAVLGALILLGRGLGS